MIYALHFMWVASILNSSHVFRVTYVHLWCNRRRRNIKSKWILASSLITTLIHRTLINYIVIKRPDCDKLWYHIKKCIRREQKLLIWRKMYIICMRICCKGHNSIISNRFWFWGFSLESFFLLHTGIGHVHFPSSWNTFIN